MDSLDGSLAMELGRRRAGRGSVYKVSKVKILDSQVISVTLVRRRVSDLKPLASAPAASYSCSTGGDPRTDETLCFGHLQLGWNRLPLKLPIRATMTRRRSGQRPHCRIKALSLGERANTARNADPSSYMHTHSSIYSSIWVTCLRGTPSTMGCHKRRQKFLLSARLNR